MPCAFSGTANECKIIRRSLESLPLPLWDGPAKGKKALCYPHEGTIYIDSAFWESLRNVTARMFIYFHECGHLEGAKCEPCADRRAGEWLRWWGLGVARDARIGALDTLENRSAMRAQEEIAEGFGFDTANKPVKRVLGSRVANGVAIPTPINVVEVWPRCWIVEGAAALAFGNTFEAAKAARIGLHVNSSFRTFEEQTVLYNRYLEAKKTNPKAPPAARPGFSNHQQGESADVSFDTPQMREDFATIASRFGIERDVPSEQWHFTFGGKRNFPLAKAGAGIAILALALALAFGKK